jgi:hypothetical protein
MKKYAFFVFVLIAGVLLSSCAAKEEVAVEVLPTNTPEPTEIPRLMPGEPPEAERTLEDVDSSIKAEEKRAITGDNILDNLYERPFTSEEMVYQPDLNILTVAFASDENFFYYTIALEDLDSDSGTLTGTYGVEFDRTQSWRGDLLAWVKNPSAQWSVDGVTVYDDPNGVVGGVKPIVAEEGFEGMGYQNTLELVEDQVAWARIAPDDPSAVQIAVSRALLGNVEEFLWGAWADGGVQDPSLFDYDDHFGPSAAGSPIKTDPDYPVKALFSLDNTCRLPYGFDQMASSIPGMCITSKPSETCECTFWVNLGATRVCVNWECH